MRRMSIKTGEMKLCSSELFRKTPQCLERTRKKTWTLFSQITHGDVEEMIPCHSGRKKDMKMACYFLIFDSVKSESLLSDKFS